MEGLAGRERVWGFRMAGDAWPSLAARRLSYILNTAIVWCVTKRNLVAVIPRQHRSVSSIALWAAV